MGGMGGGEEAEEKAEERERFRATAMLSRSTGTGARAHETEGRDVGKGDRGGFAPCPARPGGERRRSIGRRRATGCRPSLPWRGAALRRPRARRLERGPAGGEAAIGKKEREGSERERERERGRDQRGREGERERERERSEREREAGSSWAVAAVFNPRVPFGWDRTARRGGKGHLTRTSRPAGSSCTGGRRRWCTGT